MTGVEGSAEMVAAGAKAAPDVEWLHQDLGSLAPRADLRFDLFQCRTALAARSCRAVSGADGEGRARRHSRGADAAQFHRAIASADRRDGAERTVARQGRASGDAAAGRRARLLPRTCSRRFPQNIDIWETEYLQVLEGENPGQGMDQGDLADALSGHPEGRRRRPRSRPPMASGWRRPIRRMQRGRRCFRSGGCSWSPSARADRTAAMRHNRLATRDWKRARELPFGRQRLS